jgi:CBS domain-containing protein
MSSGPIRNGNELEIRERQTVWDDHQRFSELTVWCRNRMLEVSVEECFGCPNCYGMRMGTPGSSATVFCSSAAAALEDPLDSSVRNDDSADHATLASIMTTRVICVGPELSVVALAALFLERGISGAPVVDDVGRPIGMVSKTDLVREHRGAADSHERRTVEDIMMPVAFCLRPHEAVAKAAALMAYENVHRLPIINAQGQVVGVVSPIDVMRWMARRHGYVVGSGRRGTET